MAVTVELHGLIELDPANTPSPSLSLFLSISVFLSLPHLSISHRPLWRHEGLVIAHQPPKFPN